MTVATLGQEKNESHQLCGSELKSIFDSSRDSNRRRVTGLFEIVESLAQLVDELLKLADYNLDEDESELHMKATGLSRQIGSLLHETTEQPRLSLHERQANGELPAAKTDESQNHKLPSLTRRQREVLELLVQGKSNKEIARALGLGEGTVKVHMSGLLRALDVSNRAGAAFVASKLALKA